MVGININKVQAVQKKYKVEIANQQSNSLSKLRQITTILPEEVNYLQHVINYFEQPDFLLKNPKELLELKNSAIQIPTIIQVLNPQTGILENKKSEIKDRIILALNYKRLRKIFYPQYFQEIGIKACVYCNSQLTITATKYNGKHIARFDVDHYYSKDEYPFLCISLFNLYPSCASCNRIKSNNYVKFELYTEDTNKTKKSEFSFSLEPYSKAKYLISKDNSCINFKFNEKIYPDVKSFQDTFHIEELYKTQNDIIEELIIKSQIYNESYIKQLRSNFSKLSLNPKLFERMLVGNYTEEKDIHKRPMSKFIQDIAKDLNLIK